MISFPRDIRYATVTFNQIVLSTPEADRVVTRSLVEVYFKLYRASQGVPHRANSTKLPMKSFRWTGFTSRCAAVRLLAPFLVLHCVFMAFLPPTLVLGFPISSIVV
jgi:hypothetical protein